MTEIVRQEALATGIADDDRLIAIWLAGKSQNTRRSYEAAVEDLRACIDSPFAKMTVSDIFAWSQQLEGSPNTLKVRLAAVKSLLSFAHQIGYTRVNVGAVIKLHKVPSNRAKQYLTPVQVLLLIEKASCRQGAHVAQTLAHVCYCAGLRGSEAASLKWSDVLFREDERAQLHIVGKGNKARTVLIVGPCVDRLRRLRSRALGDGPVFLMSYATVLRVIKSAGEAIGVAGVTPHWLRYCHATHASENGAPIKLISDTLGHGSIVTTDTYLRSRPGDSSALYL